MSSVVAETATVAALQAIILGLRMALVAGQDWENKSDEQKAEITAARKELVALANEVIQARLTAG